VVRWLGAPGYSPRGLGSKPAYPNLLMVDCHLQVGCLQRWDHLAIRCPLWDDRGNKNPEST
jgi:hypothetical protein